MNTWSYTFTTSVGDAADRFIVHFTPMGFGDNMNEATNIYSHNKTIYINVPESTNGHAVAKTHQLFSDFRDGPCTG